MAFSRKSLEIHQALKFLQFGLTCAYRGILSCPLSKRKKSACMDEEKIFLSQFLHLKLIKAKTFSAPHTFIPIFEPSTFLPDHQHYTHGL